MHGVGLREWVALGVLAVAGVLGFMFFDPSSTDGSNKEVPRDRTIEVIGSTNGAPITTPSATVQPTATPVPAAKLGEPGGSWQIAYYESSKPGEGVRGAQGFAASLDMDYSNQPFPDFRDNDWRAVATQSMELSAGRYAFALEVDGALRVQAGDAILIDTPDSPERQTRTLEFDHKGGRLLLTIEIRDTGGPVFLRWAK
jgi:hypothetical protein